MENSKSYQELADENERLSQQLGEAMETIDAIRSGQVDALIVKDSDGGHQLFTLKSADQTYRVFIEKMSEGAVTLDANGIILYCNSKFASMVELGLSQVTGLPFESFIADDYKPVYKESFQNGWLGDYKVELDIHNAQQCVPCQLSLAKLDLDEGISLSVIITDLSFQKEAQSLLEQSNQRLEEINKALEISNHDLQQFASVASHDLQEPLRKILVYASMLENRNLTRLDEESELYLSKIVASSSRMRRMITDVLSYSNLAQGPSKYEQSNLTDIVADVLEDFEILIKEKGAQVIVGELPVAEVNRGLIRQVFQNLISNSLKFSRPGLAPVIRIFEKKAESQSQSDMSDCQIVFADNGIGFDSVYNQKIFSLFERLHTKDQYEGSGIGLAVSKKIIDKHNGTISATSKEGSGAEFIVRLPLKQS